MYYLELIQKFWEFNDKAKLGSATIALYLRLLKLAHENNAYVITVTDFCLVGELGITRKTIKVAKEKLSKYGLIHFESKAGIPTNYRIVVDYKIQEPILSAEQETLPTKVKKLRSTTKKQNSESKKIAATDTETVQKIKTEIQIKPAQNFENPTLKEFMDYAATCEMYRESLIPNIEEKYRFWQENNWKNNLGRPINNWKSSLKSALPYLEDSATTIKKGGGLPKIKRPI